jgi:hypothetical protein
MVQTGMKGSRIKKCFKVLMAACSLITVILFSVGCDRKQDIRAPEDLLPDTIMVQMLTDMFLVEGVMIQLEYLQAKEPGDAVPYYAEIYGKYKTTREAFTASMEYYARKPEHLDRIYDMAIQNLTVLQDALRKEE